VSSSEPFRKLFNQGYIQAYAFTDERGAYVPASDVVEETDGTWTYDGKPVNREYGKMGKSLKNVVTPDEMYEAFGADTFRVYEMSMGPLDVSRPWETRAVVGAQRFLQRVWRLVVDEESGVASVSDELASDDLRKALHKTIDAVHTEMDGMRFNTAIARLIELTNHVTKSGMRPREVIEPLVLMLAPFAPHVAEEMWNRLGHPESLAHHPFPTADPAFLVEETVTCVVQVQGKVRARLEVSPAVSETELTSLALGEPNVQRALDGKEPRRVIVRAPKLVNVVL
jgi:leucyl-tRNA synthetase